MSIILFTFYNRLIHMSQGVRQVAERVYHKLVCKSEDKKGLLRFFAARWQLRNYKLG